MFRKSFCLKLCLCLKIFRVSANDAEDGRTIFLKNVPFSVGNEELKEYVQQFGEVNYSLVCVDRLTEHSKGTAFVRFQVWHSTFI